MSLIKGSLVSPLVARPAVNVRAEQAPSAALQNAIRIRERPRICGKFVSAANERLLVRGVTYGPFAADGDPEQYRSPDLVQSDFSMMSQNGINAIRTYTVPPV